MKTYKFWNPSLVNDYKTDLLMGTLYRRRVDHIGRPKQWRDQHHAKTRQ